MRNRGVEFGILIAANGITGNPALLTDAHSIIATALKERRRLIVITMEEVKSLVDSSQLVHLIKEKLCDLAVRGTIGVIEGPKYNRVIKGTRGRHRVTFHISWPGRDRERESDVLGQRLIVSMSRGFYRVVFCAFEACENGGL